MLICCKATLILCKKISWNLYFQLNVYIYHWKAIFQYIFKGHFYLQNLIDYHSEKTLLLFSKNLENLNFKKMCLCLLNLSISLFTRIYVVKFSSCNANARQIYEWICFNSYRRVFNPKNFRATYSSKKQTCKNNFEKKIIALMVLTRSKFLFENTYCVCISTLKTK